MEFFIKNIPTKKTLGQSDFPGKVCQLFKEKIVPILYKLLQKIRVAEKISKSFYVATIILIPKPGKSISQKKNYRQMFLMNITK